MPESWISVNARGLFCDDGPEFSED